MHVAGEARTYWLPATKQTVQSLIIFIIRGGRLTINIIVSKPCDQPHGPSGGEP